MFLALRWRHRCCGKEAFRTEHSKTESSQKQEMMKSGITEFYECGPMKQLKVRNVSAWHVM